MSPCNNCNPVNACQTYTFRFVMSLNGRGLSHPAPFLIRMLCVVNLLHHLNTPTASMTHRLYITVMMLFLFGIHRQPFPNGHHRRSPWISLNIIYLCQTVDDDLGLPKTTYLAMAQYSQSCLSPTIVESKNASGIEWVTLTLHCGNTIMKLFIVLQGNLA